MAQVGIALGLVGFLFIIQKSFIRIVRKESKETIEKVADLIDSGNTTERPTQLDINVLPMAIDQGKEPKILVRITDPEGGYQTNWRVEITDPKGNKYSKEATSPGKGFVYRARFPTTLPRAGVWSGVAIRNNKNRNPFEKTIE